MPARWPSLTELISSSLEGLKPFYRAQDFPAWTVPTLPTSNGQVLLGVAAQVGTLRLFPAWVQGDGSTSQFAILHGLGAVPSDCRMAQNRAGQPSGVVDLPWMAVPTDVLNTVEVSFPTAPAAGDIYFVAVIA